MNKLNQSLDMGRIRVISESDMNQVCGGLIDPFSLLFAGVAAGIAFGAAFVSEVTDDFTADHDRRVGQPLPTHPEFRQRH